LGDQAASRRRVTLSSVVEVVNYSDSLVLVTLGGTLARTPKKLRT
jgi:hypothetical protein